MRSKVNIKREIPISIFIILFWMVCVSQPLLGSREDWPFSFFGMYKGVPGTTNVFRVDIDYIDDHGHRGSVYGHNKAGFATLSNEIATLLNGYESNNKNILHSPAGALKQDDVTRKRVLEFIHSRIWNDLSKNKLKIERILIRYRSWNHFIYENRFSPDHDQIVFQFLKGEINHDQ